MLYRGTDTHNHGARARRSKPQDAAPDSAHLRVALEFSRVVAPIVERDRMKPRLERAVFGFGFVNPMLSLPQLYNVLVLKHVAGLSAITIGSALLMSVLWTLYGLLGKQRVVWTTNAVWVVLNGVTLIGITILAH
jgi:uncharacterized protein with PQ loop repeat